MNTVTVATILAAIGTLGSLVTTILTLYHASRSGKSSAKKDLVRIINHLEQLKKEAETGTMSRKLRVDISTEVSEFDELHRKFLAELRASGWQPSDTGGGKPWRGIKKKQRQHPQSTTPRVEEV